MEMTELASIADLARLLPDAVVVVDGEGRIRWANDTAERLFGVRVDALLGTSALGFVHIDDREMAALSLLSVQGKEAGTPIELRVRARDEWRLVELIGANLLDKPGVDGIVLSLRDLTDRRRWEVAGKDVNRFRSLVHNAATIILLLDASGLVMSVSAAITRMLGRDPELVEGRPLTELVVARDHQVLQTALSRARTDHLHESPTVVEVEMLHVEHERSVPFELTIVNLLDDPTVQGLVVSAHDITQLRDSLMQLESAQEKLRRQERLADVGQMASMVMHDLRNPLSTITNAHSMLRLSLGDAQVLAGIVEEYLSVAERATAQTAEIAKDLDAFVASRAPNLGPVELRKLLDEALESSPPPSDVTLHVESTPLCLNADRSQLGRVLANLIANAYQAMSAGGELRVVAWADAGEAVISVEDNGGGLAPELAERIFEPFFSTKPTGTGLGLAIVQLIVEAHSGTISVVNHEHGVRATVRLPLYRDAAPRT
jgi:PAS domain S-box-containing protein